MSDILLYEVADRVATLTLNRPELRNALSPELVGLVIQRLRQAGEDPQVKCIVIMGAGDHFSAGGDVKGFGEALTSPLSERYDTFERRMLIGNRLPTAVLECPKPVLVMARGAIAGAGMALCLAADFVLAGESSLFVAAHITLGLSLDCGLSSLLVAAMGIKAAKRLSLLGERIKADEALRLGLVTQVLPDTELASAVAALSQRLTKGPALAMQGTKALLNRAAYPGLTELLQQEATGIARCAASNDFERGVQAVLQRQTPVFE